MISKLTRVLRTPFSERFLFQDKSGKDFAALDLHYLVRGKVDGTLILFENSGVTEDMVPEILKSIDENLLPDVNIKDGDLSFTVVKGHVIGNYHPHEHDAK